MKRLLAGLILILVGLTTNVVAGDHYTYNPDEHWIKLDRPGPGFLMVEANSIKYGEPYSDEKEYKNFDISVEVVFKTDGVSDSWATIDAASCLNKWAGEVRISNFDGTGKLETYEWKKGGNGDIDVIGQYLCTIIHQNVKASK